MNRMQEIIRDQENAAGAREHFASASAAGWSDRVFDVFARDVLDPLRVLDRSLREALVRLDAEYARTERSR